MGNTRTKPKQPTQPALRVSDHKDEIRDLVNKGWTYGKIGGKLGFSRNSIASAVARLKRDGEIVYTNPPRGTKGVKNKPVKKEPTFLPARPTRPVGQLLPPTNTEGKTLMELGPHECKFAIRSKGSSHWFCGEPIQTQGPYCLYHHKIAWLPSRPNLKFRGHYRGPQ